MGKPENSPPDGQSVEQLLLSIRQAIEADSRQQPASAALRPSPDQPAPEPPAADKERAARDVRRGPGYLSQNPYRFRYSLEGSTTYMNLRNRLSSLGQRTRADTGRSMASLLGGDVRREEHRAQGRHVPPQQPQHPEPDPAQYQSADGLRTSLPPAEDHVDDFVAAELASGTVSYSPDYHEWSLDQSFEHYSPQDSVQYAETEALPQPEPAYVLPGTTAGEPVAEDELQPAEPEPEYEAAAEDAADHLPLEMMIRQIIEPELASWFDEHLPDHVSRAMPDEEAFIAMIRPLIEDWLADNLAPIVEQAVKDEIGRITGLRR